MPGATAPGFDTPLAVLEACHGRLLERCNLLEKLAVHLTTHLDLASHGADVDAQHAARSILRYFDTAAVDHHDDEERNLFPLLERAQPGGACDLVETLTLEHDELALLWRRLRPALAQLAAGQPAALDARYCARFIDLNRSHVEFENTQVLPLAARLLTPADLTRLGRAMAARRGVAYPDA